jgi:hypothetical protein
MLDDVFPGLDVQVLAQAVVHAVSVIVPWIVAPAAEAPTKSQG